MDHKSQRCCHLSTKQAIFQSTLISALFPQVLVFACVPQIFPTDLFVCLNWSEAFRLSSAQSQDKEEGKGDGLGSCIHFTVTKTKHSLRPPSGVDSSCAANMHCHVTVSKQCHTLFASRGLACSKIMRLSHPFPVAQYINIIVQYVRETRDLRLC